jgi:nitrogen fixation/metabolism regulation signal transduction histidine kinase
MRLLTNPIVLRFVFGLVVAVVAFVVGAMIIRRMRRRMVEEMSFVEEAPIAENLPLHAYNAVIQQLKQQKHELQTLHQSERRRAKTTENISAAVLSNLSSGVLFFTSNGLLRQANAAAKQILGFASPIGMSTAEIFRDAVLSRVEAGVDTTITQAIVRTLREQTPSHRQDANYITPSGDQRILEITVTPVHAADGEMLGTACLINDQTAVARIRREHELQGAISAEMALELRNSLNAISDYARQLARDNEQETVRRLATDIASEAAHVDHTIGGFLAKANVAKAGFGV